MPSLARAQLLMMQQRFDLAERELRGLLSEDPGQAELHSLLALCMLSDQSRWLEATGEAETAVGMEPDQPFVHYTLGQVLLKRNRIAQARAAAMEAVRLDPYDADYFGLLGQIELSNNKWPDALSAAESGLQIDAEHELCCNLRSVALERMGRSSEAMHSARETLSRSPESAMSHVAFGWTALNSGNYKQAQESFREALRLDPTCETARDGMILALNNQSMFFRPIYKFYVWLGRFSAKYQFAIVIGAWLMIKFVGMVGDANPSLRPYAMLLTAIYLIFVLLTWVATPLFNTFLRFHSFGKLLLNRKEIWASNLIATAITTAFVGAALAIPKLGIGAINVFGYWLLMLIPISVVFRQSTFKRTIGFTIASLIIAMLPVLGLVKCLIQNSPVPMTGIATTFGWSLLGLQIISGVIQNTPVRS